MTVLFKVARYSFSGSIPPKFEHKLRRHKQSFGKIATTVVLDEDENFLYIWVEKSFLYIIVLCNTIFVENFLSSGYTAKLEDHGNSVGGGGGGRGRDMRSTPAGVLFTVNQTVTVILSQMVMVGPGTHLVK